MSFVNWMRNAGRAAMCIAPLFLSLPGSAQAQDSFYAGKTLKIIVGFPPGGGYDVYARVLAKYLPQHIPGAPTVIVSNMPGAGSLTLANYIYNVAPKDGTEIGSVETFIPFEATFKGQGVRFDPAQFSWVGALNSEMTTCVVWHGSKIRTFQDLFTAEASFGATGSGAPPVTEPKVVNSVLGTRMKLIPGYPGTADIFLAMERGELDGVCGVGWTTLISTRGEWFNQGKLRILVQNAVQRHPSLPDTPLLLEFAKTDDQKALLTLLASPHRIGRPYLAPPGLPADRLEILRKAFDATTKNKAFLEEAQKLKVAINAVSGKEMDSVFVDVSKIDPKLIEAMIKARSE
jgi:tripartite-type tricarboxylate transporter receptor subunit TctC